MTPEERAQQLVHEYFCGDDPAHLIDLVTLAIREAETSAYERGVREERERCLGIVEELSNSSIDRAEIRAAIKGKSSE